MNLAQEATAVPTADELEALFVNNPKVVQIGAFLGRFNPIRVMKMERMEIRHSAILGWLLDPMESHGLGDQFLKAFLGEALRGQSALGYPTALDVAGADLRDAVIRREWQHIDIFIYSKGNGWGFVIENKYDSSQREGQLTKYMDRVHAGLGVEVHDLIVRGIFLTLYDEEPSDPRYAPINYATISTLLSRFIRENRQPMATEVRVFLSHYTEILEEENGLSKPHIAIEQLAKELYREHKRVLEFIVRHGSTSDFAIAAENIVGPGRNYLDQFKVDKDKFRLCYLEPQKMSFLPEAWYNGFGNAQFYWRGCEDWWAGYPLITWLALWPKADGKSGQLGLYGEVGPLTEYEFRRDLINTIQTAGDHLTNKRIKFQKAAAEEGKKFSKFFRDNLSSNQRCSGC